MPGPKGPFCQSCGMPLSKDPAGGGSEANGTNSSTYCSYCYKNGAFTEPDISLKQMQDKVLLIIIRDLHLPRFIAKHLTKNIPKLARWA